MQTTSGTPVTVLKDWHPTAQGCMSLTLTYGGHTVRVTQREPGGTYVRIILVSERGRTRQNWKSLSTKDQAEAQTRAEQFLLALGALEGDEVCGVAAAAVRPAELPPTSIAPSQLPAPAVTQQAASESAPKHTPGVNMPVTLQDYWTEFRKSPRFQKNEEHTTAGEDSRAGILIAGFGPETRMVDIDADACLEYELKRLAGKIEYTVARRSRTGRLLPPVRRTAPAVGMRSVQADMKLLRTMILWAMRKKRNDRPLLAEDPTQGYEIKEELNPKQEPADQRRFEASLAAADHLANKNASTRAGYLYALLRVVLVVLEGTGRRISAILGLRRADIFLDEANDFREPMITFRKDLDKKGVEAKVPLQPHVARALSAWLRRDRGGQATDVVFPYGPDGAPIRRDRLALAFTDVEQAANLEPLEGTLFHAYRRKFASDRAHLPNNVVMKLMGIADVRTFLDCYCKTSDTLLREVLHSSQPEWDRHRDRVA